MNYPLLIGDDVYLRGLTEDDADGSYLNWLNDQEVTKYLESGFFPYSKSNLKEYIISKSFRSDAVMLAIVEKKSERHIGNVKLEPINWIHRTAEFGILIGEKDVHGKGYGTQVLRLILDYAFFTLNLRKITLGVVAENTAAVRLYKKMGFVIEGTLKEQSFHNGHYCDTYRMGLFKKDYRK